MRGTARLGLKSPVSHPGAPRTLSVQLATDANFAIGLGFFLFRPGGRADPADEAVPVRPHLPGEVPATRHLQEEPAPSHRLRHITRQEPQG